MPVKCYVPTHSVNKGVQLPHEGSLDADPAGRDGLTFQIFPVSGYKLMINQEQEYTDVIQDYVIGGLEASERIMCNNNISV